LAGVYLTGSGPGEHGIVVSDSGELRLFEFAANGPPRMVHATAKPGRSDARLALATDQPGGLIIVTSDDALLYCGQTYTRLR
jgi:hypothetical protein